MNEFQAIAVTMALFALRCVLPLALLFAIGYAMTRLANRWESQEKGQSASGAAIPLPMAGAESPVVASALKVPCWVLKTATRPSAPAARRRATRRWRAGWR